MKNLLFLLIIAISLTGCNLGHKSEGSLTGSLKNIKSGTVLLIIDLSSNTILQKVTVEDGKFKISFKLKEPTLFGIWGENPRYDKDRLLIWLENSKIKLEGNFDYFINAKVTGSESHQIFMKLDSINKKFQGQYTNLRLLKSSTSDRTKLDSISIVLSQVLENYRSAKIKFYSSEINSEVALFYLYNQITMSDISWYGINVLTKKDIENIYNILSDKFKQSKIGELIKEYILTPEIPKVGELFIDCPEYSPSNELISITDKLGKLTIIEFWASSCGPCRIEHPSLRKLYHKYHDKGLNIISISGDTDIDSWKNAIQVDSLEWINISDLKGFNNKAFLTYGIKAIPQMLLLNENGIILDSEFAQKDMESIIEYRLKQNGL